MMTDGLTMDAEAPIPLSRQAKYKEYTPDKVDYYYEKKETVVKVITTTTKDDKDQDVVTTSTESTKETWTAKAMPSEAGSEIGSGAGGASAIASYSWLRSNGASSTDMAVLFSLFGAAS